jgi:hypothetical protein
MAAKIENKKEESIALVSSHLRLGNFLLSYGKDGSSVICQWNTFILF